MNIKTIKLYYDDEYDYPSKTDFIPFMRCYLHEDNKDHPAMIIVPGGAYRLVSASEGQLPALKFYKYNFNVFVCVYTTNFFQEIPLRSQPLEDLSRAVRIIRLNAKNWNILPQKILACGFSAGGHVVASLGTHAKDVKDKQEILAKVDNKLNLMILCYPVISMTSNLGHLNSRRSLLGDDPLSEDINYWSVEKNVTSTTPSSFIWTTANDTSVKIQNSYKWFEKCQQKNIRCALHVFSQGKHGLSLADNQWQNHKNNINYPLEQLIKFKDSLDTNSNKFREINRRLNTIGGNAQFNLEVMNWFELALNFIKVIK